MTTLNETNPAFPIGGVQDLSKNDTNRMKIGTMKRGFLTGGCLVLTGLLLEWGIGSVPWESLAWPVNGFLLAIFLLIIVSIHFFRKKIKFFRFLSTREAAIPALVFVVVLTIVMGLTRQMFWPFVLSYVYLAVILGLVILKTLSSSFLPSHSTRHPSLSTLHNPHSTLHTSQITNLFHLGFFIAMTTAALGSADVQRLKMMATVGVAESRAFTLENIVKDLPFSIELQRFVMETYDNGTPKRFASEIRVLTRSEKAILKTVEVNKPVGVNGWKIYQNGYDTKMGARSRISILELVRDPWQPAVYVGIFMMLVGAFLMIFSNIPLKKTMKAVRSHPKKAFFFGVLVIFVFFLVHHFMPILHSKTLGNGDRHRAVSACHQHRFNYGRHARRHRHRPYHRRNAFRRIVGKGSVGTLLVVGPQRNVGSDNVVNVPCLFTLPPNAEA